MAEELPTTTTALATIPKPEVIDPDVIKGDIGPAIDKFLDQVDAAKYAVSIKDEASRDQAVGVVKRLKEECAEPLENWREQFYVPVYRKAEETRELFDPRIKRAKAFIKTIMGYVADYNLKKEREEKLARERAEAEARRLQEEADRKRREAEEAERRRKEAEEAERRRQQEAKAAEERRLVAEKEAQERAEREAREAAAAETARKLKEEEEARLQHAQVADEQGAGAGKVDTILESQTPIAPVLAKPEQARDLEQMRLEQEQAARAAEEKVQQERKAAEEAEQQRRAAEEAARQAKDEADRAEAAARAAAAAAVTTSVQKEDSLTTAVTTWKWDLDSDGTEAGDKAAVMELLKAIVAGHVPIEFMGFDPKRPQDFRPAAVTKAVTDSKDVFRCPGIRAYPQRDERLKSTTRRVVGGRK